MFSILQNGFMELTNCYFFNASALSNSANMDEYLQQLDTIVEGIHQNRLKVSTLFMALYICFFTSFFLICFVHNTNYYYHITIYIFDYLPLLLYVSELLLLIHKGFMYKI